MEFEWDEEKRKDSLKQHRIDFLDAVRVFRDAGRVEGYDTELSECKGEDRLWVIGLCQGRLLHVAFTLRGEDENVVRIISARKAERYEQEEYYKGKAHR